MNVVLICFLTRWEHKRDRLLQPTETQARASKQKGEGDCKKKKVRNNGWSALVRHGHGVWKRDCVHPGRVKMATERLQETAAAEEGKGARTRRRGASGPAEWETYRSAAHSNRRNALSSIRRSHGGGALIEGGRSGPSRSSRSRSRHRHSPLLGLCVRAHRRRLLSLLSDLHPRMRLRLLDGHASRWVDVEQRANHVLG